MAGYLRALNGCLMLPGGKFLSITQGAAPLTALQVQPFPVSHTKARPIYQRRAGVDYGNVWVPFTFSGGPPSAGQIQAQVVNADTNAVIKPWASLTAVSISGSNGLGCLSVVDIGCNYLVQLRDGNQIGNAATTSAGTQRWGIGARILYTGQSNMGTTMTAGAYTDPVAGYSGTELDYWADIHSGSSYYTTDGFVAPSAIGGTGSTGGGGNAPGMSQGGTLATCRYAAQALSAKYGRPIPVCSIVWAVNSSGLQTFLLGGANQAIFANNGNTLGNFGLASDEQYGGGDFEMVVQHVGEANSDGSVSRATQKANLHNYYQQCLNQVLPFGRTAANFTYLPAVLGSYVGGNAMYAEDIRAAVMEFEAEVAATWPNVHAGWSCIDLVPPSSNGLHFVTVPDPLKSHRRMMQSVMHVLVPDMATYSGVGPRLQPTATRNGLTATFTVVHDGGTQLVAKNSGAPITGWYANTKADFTGIDIGPLTVAINGTSKVDVTFPSGTDFTNVWVKLCGGHIGTAVSVSPDVSNLIYDNAVYPYCKISPTDSTNLFAGDAQLQTGFPILQTANAIQVT
jgi:hypothetical protein